MQHGVWVRLGTKHELFGSVHWRLIQERTDSKFCTQLGYQVPTRRPIANPEGRGKRWVRAMQVTEGTVQEILPAQGEHHCTCVTTCQGREKAAQLPGSKALQVCPTTRAVPFLKGTAQPRFCLCSETATDHPLRHAKQPSCAAEKGPPTCTWRL